MTVQTCQMYDKNGIKEEFAKDRLMSKRECGCEEEKGTNELKEWGERDECFCTDNSDKTCWHLLAPAVQHTAYTLCMRIYPLHKIQKY